MFETYKEQEEGVIGVDGTMQLCQDLGVDPSDVSLLVLAYRLGCPRMCEFQRDGFVSGLSALKYSLISYLYLIIECDVFEGSTSCIANTEGITR